MGVCAGFAQEDPVRNGSMGGLLLKAVVAEFVPGVFHEDLLEEGGDRVGLLLHFILDIYNSVIFLRYFIVVAVPVFILDTYTPRLF